MADIYFYKGTPSQQEVLLLLHMDTPAGNNANGIPFSTVVLLSGYSSGKSLMPSGDGTNGTIDPAEREALALGTRIEFISTYSVAVSGPSTITNVRNWRTNVEIPRITAEINQLVGLFGVATS